MLTDEANDFTSMQAEDGNESLCQAEKRSAIENNPETMDVDCNNEPSDLSLIEVNNLLAPLQKRQHLSTQPSPPSPQDRQDDSVQNFEEFDDTEDIYEDNDEAKPSGSIELRVSKISDFKEQALSSPIMIRCLPWKILFMLRAAPGAQDRNQKSFGFFVQCNADSESTSWNCQAKAELRIVSQKSDCEDVVRRIEHNFFSKENDWGFASFITCADLLNPAKGLVLDDGIILQVNVQADAPHGVDWDSKLHTGFVGLKNQGATCYMNSLLQTLYCTNKLRKAVYLMPTDSDDSSRSVPLALQRVFYELQHSDKAVGTKKLTRSFGWETLDSFMQHDAQELCRVLIDNMENKMKGTRVEDKIPSLFRGKMLSYIKCKHVSFESKREENFYDIQLKVKANVNIYQAFSEYTAVETLDQDNKYDAGDHGLQEAEKGVTFLKFPPVLYLQLMRFQYDHIADANIKVNDRFEFPYRLDLEQYLEKNSVSPTQYFLHAVLVHSGDNHGGHYVVFLNPHGDNRWFKFDDDVVSRCSRREAILHNYGGYEEDLGIRLSTNAYMLVYIADSAKDEVLCPVTDSDIPEILREFFLSERKAEAQKRMEKAEAHLYLNVHIYLDEDFYGWQGYDLYNQESVPIRRLRVLKSVSPEEFLNILSQTLHQPRDKIRPWALQMRKNHTHRVTCMDLKEIFVKQEGPLNVWVQCLPPDCPQDSLPPFDITEDLLFFLKYFNPLTQTIHYCGTMAIRLHTLVSSILPELKKRAGLSEKEPLLLFEERKPLSVEPIPDFDKQIGDCVNEVMDGNILVFQQVMNDRDTAADYFRDFFYRLEVIFVDKLNPADPGFALTLSTKLTYSSLAFEVAHYLNIEPDYIQFSRAHSGLGQRETGYMPIKSTFEGTLKDLVSGKSVRRLYFQRLTLPVTELENMQQLRCVFVNSRLKESDIVLSLNKNSTVSQLLEEASQKIELMPGGSGKLRLVEVVSSKLTQDFPGDLKLSQIPASANRVLRVEEIPLDELTVAEDETVIHVAHFHRDIFTTFGTPFTLKIRDGEAFSAVRERIRRRLDVPEKEFDKWRFAIISTRLSYLPEDVETIVRLQLFNTPPPQQGIVSPLPVKPWLGLEHKFPPKRPRYTLAEKPIKIHN